MQQVLDAVDDRAGGLHLDVLGLVVAWGGSWLAQMAPSARFSYGFKKASILSALINALVLLVAIGAIGAEAVRRLFHPSPTQGQTVIIVAAVGIWALHAFTSSYESALTERRVGLIPALRTESEVRGSNTEYLRYLVQPADVHLHARDSIDAVITGLLTQLHDSALTDESRRDWQIAADQYAHWRSATDSSLAAKRSGGKSAVLNASIRSR